MSPDPGYQYTNTDYVLLGLVIEKAANRPVEDSFQRYLLANPKIGLTSTYYLPQAYPILFSLEWLMAMIMKALLVLIKM